MLDRFIGSLETRARYSTLTDAPSASLRQDSAVIALVGTAHGASHFFQLLLPPLFPLIKAEFDVSYAQLGVLLTIYYVISGVSQTLAGFAVDRLGARRVLLFGIVMIALPALLAAIAPNFWVLAFAVVIAGLGNSVFHPADFTILNARVDPARLGHAFSVHGISGSLGWAAAPLAMTGLAVPFGWRGAMLVAGLGLLAFLVVLYLSRARLDSAADAIALRPRKADASAARATVGAWANLSPLLTTPVWLCFGYFILLSMALSGLQSFAIPATMDVAHVGIATATMALTSYFLGSTAGTLLGGFLASWTKRHDVVAASGMTAGACLFLVMSTGIVSAWWVIPLFVVAGFSSGVTGPSRDLIVRGATPKGATGRVYGFVYSGLDAGAALVPVLVGWMLDRGHAAMVFLMVGIVLLLGVGTVIQVKQRSAPGAATTQPQG